LRWIAAGRGAAAEYRTALNRVVAAHVKPRPCRLQVWELAVTTTRDGVDPAAFASSRWTLRLTWPVDEP
jgi:hypothetical protein